MYNLNVLFSLPYSFCPFSPYFMAFWEKEKKNLCLTMSKLPLCTVCKYEHDIY